MSRTSSGPSLRASSFRRHTRRTGSSGGLSSSPSCPQHHRSGRLHRCLMKVHDSSQSLGRGTESPAYFARPLWPYRGRPRLFETACEAWSDSRVRLSISEQSIVFPIRENLENQNQSASSRSGLDRVDAALREWQLEPPSVRARRRKATTRRESRWHPIRRNLVPTQTFRLQRRDPPVKLFPLLGLKLLFAG